MVAAFVRNFRLKKIDYQRQMFTFSDGGEVGLDWVHDNHAPDTPIVLILPGITGSSQSDYNRALVNVLRHQVKARVVVFNFRGRGGMGLKSPRTYCAANSEDLSEILEFIKTTYPLAPLVALGVSLGNFL